MNLTREEIENMPAGRKMRELVATRVMKWRLFEPIDTFDDRPRLYWFDQDTKTTVPVDSWMPDENINQAWQVIKKIDKPVSIIESAIRGSFWCEFLIDFDKDNVIGAKAETETLAICRAALIAVMEAK